MRQRVLNPFILLAGLAMIGSLTPVLGSQPYAQVREIRVEGHRCLVADPAVLPDDAPVIFILHGLGANAEDLFPLIAKMNLPPCRYVLPDAPIAIGDRSYAWYNFETQSREDIVHSRDYLFRLMDRFSKEGEKQGHARPVVLMGFSQGGVMSMEAGVNYPGRIAAIVSMSGYLWYPSQTLARPLAPLGTPILLVHGTRDKIVTEDWTRNTVKALKGAGYKPVFKEFPIAHQISLDSLNTVAEFIREVLAKAL